ncbi:hypothetical protein BT96DRAFT_1022155 [Gymnopus androsaceus JB14]|uniref:Uncharacterized protein n=1 Tax=Gymnopus androsaceus JB14 TaxID=1447944 RepID=A0A6A4HBH1_9AGAR|nr:hypothetical protein BT96DRAFT_1022155 [Gymnopus androsaceus JB14]
MLPGLVEIWNRITNSSSPRYSMHDPAHSDGRTMENEAIRGHRFNERSSRGSLHRSSHDRKQRDDSSGTHEGNNHRMDTNHFEGSLKTFAAPSSSFHFPVHPHTGVSSRMSPVDDRGEKERPEGSVSSRRQEQIQLLEAKLQEAHRENRAKDDEIGQLKRRLSSAQAEIRQYQTKDARSQELLDTRKRELQGARAFLNTADAYSGGDLIEMLNTLNSEIFQAAAVITDSIEGMLPSRSEGRPDDPSAVEEVRKVLGEELLTLLQGKGEADELMLIQAALQAGLNIRVEYILRLWMIPGSANDAIQGAYTGIRAEQEQVLVPGTWRSLTRAQTKRSVYQDPEVHRYLVKDDEKSMAFERVSTILELLAKLDKAMNERVTSTEMMLYLPPCGASFKAREMEDADGGKSSNGVVMLVGEMGLDEDRQELNGERRDELSC